MRAYAERTGMKLGAVAQPLRAALTGRTTSPGIFDVLAVLGKGREPGANRAIRPSARPSRRAAPPARRWPAVLAYEFDVTRYRRDLAAYP